MYSNIPPQETTHPNVTSPNAAPTADVENPGHTDVHPLTTTSGATSTEPHSEHLSAQHGIIGCQLFTTGMTGATGSPIAQIPGRVIQAAISVRTFFRPPQKVSKLEKTAHGIQAILALVLLGIAIKRYQDNDECHDTTTALCKNEILCQTLYSTVLLLCWGPSQIINHTKLQPATPSTRDTESSPPTGIQLGAR